MRTAPDNSLQCANCHDTIGAGEPIAFDEEGLDIHGDGCVPSFFAELAKPTRTHQHPPGSYRGPQARKRTVCPACRLERPCDCE